MDRNKGKAEALGMPFGTASNRLRKMILFRLLRRLGEDMCFRCTKRIEDVSEVSVEHKVPWQTAGDPVSAFFDLENVAFSHLSCNSAGPSTSKSLCPNGHPYTSIQAKGRCCLICRRFQNRRYWNKHGRDHRREKRRLERHSFRAVAQG